ncbi:MAG: replicative DNA helicase [Candidatus Binatia bacterium]|nr:MAG: replicative DNA helicase [Candidatus Binatia bacterium]
MKTEADDVRRLPPQSLDAEQSVLGGILLDTGAIDRAVELLSAEDFYREAHRKIFRAMLALSQRGEPVDVVTLANELTAEGCLEEVGGTAYLVELAERVPTAANLAYYARIVREKAILREVIQAATELAASAYEARPGEVDDFLDRVEHRIFEISERRVRPQFAKMNDLMLTAVHTIESLYERRGLITGVPTGFVDLDRLTSGLQPADLIIVAARPGMGKTAFALNVAVNAAQQANVGVAVFSLEMSKQQLALRMLCSEAGVDSHNVRTGYLASGDFQKIVHAADRLSRLPIFIDDTPGLSILELRAKARRLKREQEAKLGLVVVDYLQLMRGHERTDNREQEISSISRSLKALAKELDIPVMALAQLNRQVESRADRRPIMADLRESGAIEQDADLILFLFRPWVYEKKKDNEHDAEVIIGKQRNGPTDIVKLTYLPEYTRFENRTEMELVVPAEDEL